MDSFVHSLSFYFVKATGRQPSELARLDRHLAALGKMATVDEVINVIRVLPSPLSMCRLP